MVYWLTFVAALFCGKIIDAEMMGVLQVSFIGTICLDPRSMSVLNAPYLRYSNGWNPLFNDIGIPGQSVRLTSMGLRSVFLSDYNLMLLILLLPYLFALGVYCVERVKLSKKPALPNESEKLPTSRSRVRSEILTDYLLTITLVSTYSIIFPFLISLWSNSPLSVPSTVFGSIAMAYIFGIAIYYVARRSKFR